MTQYFITGANGWLGTQLVSQLSMSITSADKIICFLEPKSDVSKIEKFSAQIIYGDVRNPIDCERFFAGRNDQAWLIHTAGIIHPRRISDFYDINVSGTKNITAAAIKVGVERAVFVSSNSPCGNNPNRDHRFDETSPYNPYMNYGRSKMLMEQMIHKNATPLKFAIIRAPWFYGPNQPARQTQFFSMVKSGGFPIVGDGLNLRSMAYLENLVDGIMLALKADNISNDTFWIADERPYSMQEIISTVKKVLSEDFAITCSPKNLQIPGVVGDIATIADYSLQKLGIYNQKIHVLSEMNKTIACSIEKAKSKLLFQPKFDLRAGMRKSVQWCLDNNIKF